MTERQVIECKDCQFYKELSPEYHFCAFWSDTDEQMVEPNGFCSNAVERTDE